MKDAASIALLLLAYLGAPSLAQSCSKSIMFGSTPKEFAACVDLPSQGAKLAWSYNSTNNTLGVAFSGTSPSTSGWVGWGINPGRPLMIGTSALVAFQASNGSNMLDYKLTSETQGGELPSCSAIDLIVLDRAVDIKGRNVNMYALIQLKPNQTKLNHIWNRGPGVTSDFKLQEHPTGINDVNGRGLFDISSGTVSSASPSHQDLKNAHGFINAFGWGILLPLGAMSARYLRHVHDPAWFYLHVFFQITGYILGVAGWAIGLRLGSYSEGVVRYNHRNIGITMFVFGTLQILGGALRPKPDHKVRPFFNVFHHTIGYLILILAFVNIFKGLDILQPRDKWRKAYIAILVVLAIISFVLEVTTWAIYLKKKRAEKLAHKPVSNGRQVETEL